MEKKLVRKEILNMRNNMSNEKRILKDKLIYNLFMNSDLYKKSKDIFIYVSFGSEVNTHEIIKKAIIDKKNIYEIPYNVIGYGGKLKGIKINNIKIKGRDLWDRQVDAIVCPCMEKLSKENEFNALLSRGIL